MLSGETASSGGTSQSRAHNSSSRSFASSATSLPGPRGSQPHARKPLSPLSEDKELRQYDPAGGSVTLHVGAGGPSNALPTVPHAPLDLIRVVSVPSTHAASALAALKLRMLRNALDFVLAQTNGRDRVVLVMFETGADGVVRKTSLLAPDCTHGQLVRMTSHPADIQYAGDAAREDRRPWRGDCASRSRSVLPITARVQ
jgi:hypothetical protein